MQNINKETEKQLQQLSAIHANYKKNVNKYLLFLPAIFGFVTHLLFFLCLQLLAKKFKGSIHYHSILFVLIAFVYPLYLAALFVSIYAVFNGTLAVVIILLLPFLAKAFILWK